MAVDVLSEIVIDRPCEQVAAYAADPTHAPDWYVNIASIEWLTDPPVRVGSRMAFVARFLGRRLAYTYEIVEFDCDYGRGRSLYLIAPKSDQHIVARRLSSVSVLGQGFLKRFWTWSQ